VSVIAMEEKKAQRIEESRTKHAVNFVGDIKVEFAKISWTSREELKIYTKTVIFATFVFGMAVYLVDLIIQNSLAILDFLIRLIIG
jgi:preprotein translocase subunit SecE